MPQHRADGLGAVRGLGDDRDAGLVKDHAESGADQGLIVGDHHPRRIGHVPRGRLARAGHGRAEAGAGARSGAGPPPASSGRGSSGSRAVTRQPPAGRGPASNAPPYSDTRSRRPSNPRPPGSSGPPGKTVSRPGDGSPAARRACAPVNGEG